MESAHTDVLYFIAKEKTYLIKDDILYIVSHDGLKYMPREICFMAIQEAIKKNSGEVYLKDPRDNSSIKVVVENKPLSEGNLYEHAIQPRCLWFLGKREREIELDIVVLRYGAGEYSFTRVCRPRDVSIPDEEKNFIINLIIQQYNQGVISNSFYHSITDIDKGLLCTSAFYRQNFTVLENKSFGKWEYGKDGDMKCELVKQHGEAKYKASYTDLSNDDSTRNERKSAIENMLVTLLNVDTEMFLTKEEVQWYSGKQFSSGVFLSIDDCVMDESPRTPHFSYGAFGAC